MPSPALSCRQALKDATTTWPDRKRESDGIMGDPAHQARKSDHNDGNAFDLTHDVAHGVDCRVLSRLVMRDARVKYVIFNREIFKTYKPAEGWRPYTGSNPHNHHMHVSIKTESRDDVSPWPWSAGVPDGAAIPNQPVVAAGAPAYPGVVLRQGSKGPSVSAVQQRLKDLGFNLGVDGDFGSGTLREVSAFQQQKGLGVDGKVGPTTWRALFAN
jgi:hypothetical protein